MKVKSIFVIMLSIALLFVTSCTQETDHATLRVNLRQDRSILPENFPLEIASYNIRGTGPNSGSFNVETNKETISLDGLVIGEWHITAEGVNENGDVLVTGHTTHRLSATNGSCTIVMENLVGNGTLDISLSWDPERISGEANVELELTPQYGEKIVKQLELTSISKTDGTATYKGSDYPSGSYVLAARLYDGTVQVAGFVEAVRIAGDQVSRGEIAFDLDKYPIEPGTLELINKTGVPVSCFIEGLSDTVIANQAIAVRITSDTDEVDDYSIVWYLDGTYIGEGPEISITPAVGTHRLDVVASTSRIGTSGSALFNFEAVSISDPGVPAYGSVIEDGENIELSGKTVIKFLPDGNVMILSNSEQKVYIASMIRNNLDIKREYTFTELNITGNVVDFDSIEVNRNLSKVLLAQEDPYLVIVYNYNPSSISLTEFSHGTPEAKLYGGTAISAIHGVNVLRDVKVDGCGLGVVTIQNRDAEIWEYVYVSLTKDTGSNSYFTMGAYTGKVSSGYPADKVKASNTSLLQLMRDGSGLLTLKTDNSGKLKSLYFLNPSESYPSSSDDFDNTTTFTLLSEDKILLFGNKMLTLEYDLNATSTYGWVINDSQPLTHEASSAITSKDFRYVYYIDLDSDEIVTLEILGNGSVTNEIGRTPIAKNGMDTIAMSESGINFIVYDEDNADSLMILRATR